MYIQDSYPPSMSFYHGRVCRVPENYSHPTSTPDDFGGELCGL